MGQTILKWAPCSIAILLTGCGGNGQTGNQPSARTVDVFATGNLNKGYSHIWVTINRVVLTNGVSSAPIFDAAATGGLRLDLCTLNDKSGPLYLFLGSKEYETGLFTEAKVYLSNTVTLVPLDRTGPRDVKIGDPKDATATVDVDVSRAKSAVPGSGLVLDFDSSKWTAKAGLVSAPKGKFVVLGAGAGLLDSSRLLKQTLVGTVANLDGSGSAKQFSLNTTTGAIEVEGGAPTKPEAATKPPAPALTEGQAVKVTGTYDPSSGVFKAVSVEPATPVSLPKPSGGPKHK